MNVPHKAVDAIAAKYEGWPEESDERREYLRELIRDDLELAAPFIAAQALRDAAADLNPDAGGVVVGTTLVQVSARVIAEALQVRADGLDPQ